MVGRTPRSARVPLDPLFLRSIRFLHRRNGPTGASAADQGVRPTINAGGFSTLPVRKARPSCLKLWSSP
jgi:hypothetical protein